MGVFPIQNSGVRGEISPRTHARIGLDWYNSAFEKVENYFTLSHGPFRKRSGTTYNGDARNTDRVRMIDFIGSQTDAFVLEFDTAQVRVRKVDGTLVQDGGDYMFTHPFTNDPLDIFLIDYTQSNDVIFMTCPGYQPRKLSRVADNNWTFELVEFLDGPFDEVNIDRTQTIQASSIAGTNNFDTGIVAFPTSTDGKTGRIRLTANFNAFTADDVGTIVRLEEENLGDITSWTSSPAAITLGTTIRHEGNVYVVTDQGTPNFGAPTHKIGTLRYGLDNAPTTRIGYTYMHSQKGFVKIDNFVSATVVEGEIVSERPNEDNPTGVMPVSILNATTYRWSKSLFSGGTRWPSVVTLAGNRLVYAAGIDFALSKVNNFNSFDIGEGLASDAIVERIAGDQFNEIIWAQELGDSIVIGTVGGIRILFGRDGPIKPNDIGQRLVKKASLSSQKPINADDSLFVVGWPGINVYEVSFSGDARSYVSPDATLLSEHIAKVGGGIVQMALQRRPDTNLYAVLSNGEIAVLTFNKEQGVAGWSRIRVGGTFGGNNWGKVESIAVIPGEKEDKLFMTVRRTINGAERLMVENLADLFEYDVIENSVMADSHIRYSGASTSTVDLSHLDGEQVVVRWGKKHATLTASAATALPEATTEFVAGLAYSGVLKTLRPNLGGQDGTRLGRSKRVAGVILDLLESLGLKKVASNGDAEWLDGPNSLTSLQNGEHDLKTGTTKEVSITGKFEDHGQVEYISDTPYPCTIRAFIPNMERN